MVVYAPLELIATKLTLSFSIAFALGTPLLMYELLAFAGKGLYPGEKRFFMKIVQYPSCYFFLVLASHIL